jgi:REP element-mobilizing transposase RayT
VPGREQGQIFLVSKSKFGRPSLYLAKEALYPDLSCLRRRRESRAATAAIATTTLSALKHEDDRRNFRSPSWFLSPAYCLMPNHLLLESSDRPLVKLMQGLQQSYSQYYNRKHHKTGHVFEGRYKAIICHKDEYLLELIRYIHLNPVRAEMVKSAEEHRYSGHHTNLHGKATETIDPGKVLAMLGGKAAYRRFVSDGLLRDIRKSTTLWRISGFWVTKDLWKSCLTTNQRRRPGRMLGVPLTVW